MIEKPEYKEEEKTVGTFTEYRSLQTPAVSENEIVKLAGMDNKAAPYTHYSNFQISVG
jgi:hypothetical protein